MFRSATFKLTVWYLAIITSLSIAFSIVIYHFASTELQVGLHHQTLRIYRDFPVFNNDPLLRPGSDLAVGQHHILLRLIYFNMLVVVITGFASYFLARRTLRPIEEAHNRQRRFTADVSHELRTPLTALTMTAEVALLDTQAAKTDLREALSSTVEEAKKMNRLINNLLRLTRLDDEQTQAQFSQLDAVDIVTTAINQVQSVAETKQVSFKNQVTKSPVYGDKDSLVQLLVILLDNAIKYSPTGKTITVSSLTKDTVSILHIRDEGPGIAKDDLPHVFDRFYRADSSRTKEISHEGYGLGLSIAKLICDRHNGQITLTSRPGQGTTATIELPAQAALPPTDISG